MSDTQKEIQNIIQQLPGFSLSELNELAMMSRFDEKFFFHKSRLAEVLKSLVNDVKVLNIDSNCIFSYETKYLDTPDMELYMKHHNKRNKRYKLRYRKYLDTDLHFLEIKLKNSKGEMHKSRIKVQDQDNGKTVQKILNEFVAETSPYDLSQLDHTLIVNYQRMTLLDPESRDILTIDQNLSFRTPDKNGTILNNLVILELKQKRQDANSVFRKCLRKHGIRPKAISKYCLGVSYLYDNLKSNAFKEQWRQVNKIENYA